MSKVTIKDVAKRAGVSISTVSNALNGIDVLTPKTKKRILEVANKLNYIPDLRGRNLKAKKTKVISFFTSKICGDYFHQIVEAMVKECEKNDYSLNIVVSENKERIKKNIFGGSMDGIIVYAHNHIEEDTVESVKKQNIKTIFLDREEEGKNTGGVLFDSYRTGYKATSHLITLGHRNIVFVSEDKDTYHSKKRQAGYRAALRDSDIKFKSENIIDDVSKEEDYQTLKSFLRKKTIPDAFMIENYWNTVGVVSVLKAEGLMIPGDVSVIGLDDHEMANYCEPKITTIHYPIAQQGELAIQHIMELIDGKAEGQLYKVPCKIIERDTCAKKK